MSSTQSNALELASIVDRELKNNSYLIFDLCWLVASVPGVNWPHETLWDLFTTCDFLLGGGEEIKAIWKLDKESLF